ncbi:MAG: ABC transporter ATP-binding protein [Phycisphaerae bacterium]|nr:ABC transporter ATP-binding protein [Phycisphaerae bacterium]
MSNNPKNLFELQGVSCSFGSLKVIDNLDFGIERGKTTVIIGPSGCGKTVLLKHLIMLIRPSRGKVFFDGKRIDQFNERKLIEMRRRCGFLFQAGALFDSQTVAYNVSFPLYQHTNYSQEQIDDIVREKLEMVGLPGLEDRFPSQLSGGQQKRIALARAISLNPEVVLYDEPTTGLDPIRADTINELILKLQKQLKITSIAVTHDMQSAYKIADRIVMFNHGRVIVDGTADEIRNSADPKVQQFIQGRSEELGNK